MELLLLDKGYQIIASSIVFCILLISFFYSPVVVQAADLDIFVSRAVKSYPGSFVTHTLKIINNTAEGVSLKAEFDIPVDWELISQVGNINVDASSKEVVFLTFKVPMDSEAGQYKIGVKLYNEKQVLIARRGLMIGIFPLYGVRLRLTREDMYLLKGEKKPGVLYIKNIGNVAGCFTLKTDLTENISLSGLPEEVNLLPGEEKELDYSIQTSSSVKEYQSEITFIAANEELVKPAVVYQSVSIVSSMENYSEKDYLQTVPGSSRLRYNDSSDGEDRLGGYLSLGGEYKEDQWFDLFLSSSDFSSGLDYYRFDLEDDDKGMSLGHIYNRLSPLGYYNGEGISFINNKNNNPFKIFAVKDKDGNERDYGLGKEYQLNDKLILNLGTVYLDKKDSEDRRLLGTGLEYSLTDETNLGLDYGRAGNATSSWGVSAELDKRNGYLEAKYLLVDPDYPGDDAGKNGFMFKGGGKVNSYTYLSADADIYEEEFIEEDDLECKKLRVYSSLYPEGYPYLYAGINWGETQLLDERIDSQRNNGYMVGTSLTMGRLGFSLGISHDRIKNLLEDTVDNHRYKHGSLYYWDKNWNSWFLYEKGDLDSDSDFDLDSDKEVFDRELGFEYYHSNIDLTSWFNIRCQDESYVGEEDKIETDRAEIGTEYYLNDSNWNLSLELAKERKREDGEKEVYISLGPGIEYEFANNSSIGVKCERLWYREPDHKTAWKYQITLDNEFDMPVPGVRRYACVTGVVFLDENNNGQKDGGEEGLAGVLLRLDGINTLSDKDGRFIFPPLEAGLYRFEIDNDQPGLDYSNDIIREVELARGEKFFIDLPFREVGLISGNIFIDNDLNGRKGFTNSGVKGITVLLSNQKTTYQAESNSDGLYSARVETGEYQVSLVGDDIKDYALTTLPELEIEVEKGGRKRADFGLYSKTKEIIFTYNSLDDGTADNFMLDCYPIDPGPGELVKVVVYSTVDLKSVMVEPVTEGGVKQMLLKEDKNLWTGKIKAPEDISGQYHCKVKAVDYKGYPFEKEFILEVE